MLISLTSDDAAALTQLVAPWKPMVEIRYIWYMVLVLAGDWPSILDDYRVLRTPGWIMDMYEFKTFS